ncbi:MAG TPA: hypothetical protein VLD67_11645 [Vicinamibacterales bacterium]|nr:hypothetical protein [Vicinamibacterales bacterium]
MPQYRVFGLTVTSELPLPELPSSRQGGAACTIEVAPPDGISRHEWFHRWRLHGRCHLEFARTASGYLLRFPGLVDAGVTASGDRISWRPHPGVPVPTVRHLLIDQVLPLALSRMDRLVLHASAVHVPQAGAVAFAGRSGRGKSTIAAALGRTGWPILTDDCLVLMAGAGGFRVMPGYPGVRVWADAASALDLGDRCDQPVAHYTTKRRVHSRALAFRDAPSRLRALFVLGGRYTGGPPIRVTRLGGRAGFFALTPFINLLDIQDRRHLARAFAAAADLAGHVPVYRLRIRHEPRAFDDVVAALTAALPVPAGCQESHGCQLPTSNSQLPCSPEET